MFDSFFSDEGFIYSLSLVLSMLITLLETVTFFFGGSLSALVGSTDSDAGDFESHVEPSAWFKIFYWFRVGKIPLMATIILFLTYFGLSGFSIHALADALFSVTLHWKWSFMPAAFSAAALHRLTSGILSKFVFKEESSALSEESFLGQEAEIVIGIARKDHPAQAKLKDHYGQLHYILVEPDDNSVQFHKGDKVEICDFKKLGASRIFLVVRAEDTPLLT